ncbi:MAG TPA: hypothetical protein VKD22_01870 [Ramlibacter sp.]|nr:hypothetical protein [Ramlibacter sp.]
MSRPPARVFYELARIRLEGRFAESADLERAVEAEAYYEALQGQLQTRYEMGFRYLQYAAPDPSKIDWRAYVLEWTDAIAMVERTHDRMYREQLARRLAETWM